MLYYYAYNSNLTITQFLKFSKASLAISANKIIRLKLTEKLSKVVIDGSATMDTWEMDDTIMSWLPYEKKYVNSICTSFYIRRSQCNLGLFSLGNIHVHISLTML